MDVSKQNNFVERSLEKIAKSLSAISQMIVFNIYDFVQDQIIYYERFSKKDLKEQTF